MVKNLSTIDRSERVRIGKHVPNEQAVNTIIINASSNVIEASQEGFYLAPIRVNEAMNSNAMCYDITTNEVVDSGKALTFQGLSEVGNSTTETIQFTNNTTGFVTTSNVGIANTNPQHELSVGGDVYVEGNLTVIGETTAISSENLRVKDAIIELGENNTDGDFVFDLGLIMTRPGSNVTASYIESSNEYIIGYTQNSASDTYITPDASNLIQMRVYGDVTANRFIGDGSFLSNVIQDTDLDANLTVIRDEMAANTLTLRDDIQSNANVLRGEMAANTLILRTDIQSNANVLRGEMAANTLTLRDDLQSNVTVLMGEMAANTLTLRDDLQSNANVLRGEMAANTVTLRSDLQSNITISQNTMRSEMAANTVALRADLQSNATTLRGEMAANTVTLRNEIALKSNINNPVFTGIITGDGGAISNISLQHVTEYGNSTDQTITMSNTLSLITSGSVGINTPTPQKMLHVAGEILADDDITGVDFFGDDATFTGGLTVSGDSLFYGNLEVRGNTTYLSTQNLLVEDPILALGANNTSSSLDTGIIVLVYQGDSNVAFGYRGASNEFIISHTLSSPDDSELIPDTSNAINVHVYGNVTADEYRGDGTALTGIALETDMISNVSRISVLETDLTSNATRVSVLETDLSSNASRISVLEQQGLSDIVDIGNVSSNTIQLTNPDVGLLATGNVEAARFIGDGSYLTGISTVSNLEGIVNNGNVSSNTIQLTNADVGLKATGNIEANYFVGDGSRLTGITGGGGGSSNLEDTVNIGNVSSNTIQLTNSNVGLVATGNIEASYFKGDGSELTGISTVSNLEGIVLNGNVTSQTIHIQNTVSLTTTGNVGIANTNPMCDLAVGSNLCVNDISSNVLTVDGNILAHKLTLDSIQLAAGYSLQYVTNYGNTTSNTIEFTNSATGLVTTANVGIANSNPIHTLDVGSNLWVEDTGSNVLYVNGNVHVAGSQLTVGEKLGIGNTTPGHDLSVGSNLYVEDTGSNVLVIDGNASINSTLFLGAVEISPAYTLEEVTGQGNVTSNVIQFTNADVGLVATGNVEAARFIGDGSHLTGLVTDLQSVVDNGNVSSNVVQFTNTNVGAVFTGGIVINDGSYKCKHYAYSNVSVPTNFANVAMTFTSNVFHAKITAQLTHGNEEVSTMILDVQGGTRNGTTSSLNIASGPGSVFGHNNTKPWSMSVGTTPTKVILEPSSAGTSVYGVDVYIEYKSSSTEGKLESINIGADTVKSFVY